MDQKGGYPHPQPPPAYGFDQQHQQQQQQYPMHPYVAPVVVEQQQGIFYETPALYLLTLVFQVKF